MKFADRPSVDVEVLVDAPPERVWDVATDLASLGDPGAEYQGGEWVDGTGPALGARLLGRNKREDFAWETTSVITEFEPPRSFEWAVGNPAFASATWRFDLTPEGDGTRLRQSAVLGPGPSGLTMAIDRMPDKEERIIERRCEEQRRLMTATLETIKARAESS